MDENAKKKWLESVVKKAVGYRASETQEEYALVEGVMTLVKRKIIRKDIPPDTAALRLLLGDEPPETVSIEEIERERAELTAQFFERFGRGNGGRKRAAAARKKQKSDREEQDGTDGQQV